MSGTEKVEAVEPGRRNCICACAEHFQCCHRFRVHLSTYALSFVKEFFTTPARALPRPPGSNGTMAERARAAQIAQELQLARQQNKSKQRVTFSGRKKVPRSGGGGSARKKPSKPADTSTPGPMFGIGIGTTTEQQPNKTETMKTSKSKAGSGRPYVAIPGFGGGLRGGPARRSEEAKRSGGKAS